MDVKTMTLAELQAERPDLVQTMETATLATLDMDGSLVESGLRAAAKPDPALQAEVQRLTEANATLTTEIATLKSVGLVESALREADLPADMTEFVRAEFAGRIVTADEVKTRVEAAKSLLESHRPSGVGGAPPAGGGGTQTAGELLRRKKGGE